MRVLRALLLLCSASFAGTALAAPSGSVHVDQHGYAPAEPKWVAVGTAATSFQVIRAADGSVALSGALALRRSADPASGDDVYAGDFTALSETGAFYVHVAGVGDSPVFAIQPGNYDDLYRRLLKGLFYQRCGTEIAAAHGGAWTHDVCHAAGASIASYDWSTTGGPPGGYRNTIGGWHDAGDYGKYSTNNAYTVGELLQAYELYPAKFALDDCDLPESGNGVPDLLDETRWSLQWMLTMQDPDGGVHHRESIANYAGDYVPESDPVRRYYTSVSSDATAAQCAALAIAGRVYRAFDPAFAAACSTSATQAWAWLQAHPTRVPSGGFVNLYGHTGATYVGATDDSHRLWAAAEIFRLNGAPAAHSYVDAHWGDTKTFNGVWYPDGWGDLANLGAFTYRDTPGATAAIRTGNWWSIENSTLSSCVGWSTRVNADGYGCAAATDGAYGDYYWGFTGVVLRYAWTLLEAYRYSGNAAYETAAREQLHYVLGRNPLGKVYVTGIGTRPVLHSHGAWNLAGGYTNVVDSLCHPIPFQLVGGPNKADNSSISTYPGRCYEDIADPNYFNKGNYTLNETSINIQAAFLVLAGYFSSGGAVTSVDAPAASASRLTAWPNPARGSVRFSWRGAAAPGAVLEIYNVAGRRVWSAPAPASGSATWDLARASFAPGVYLARLGALRVRFVALP